MKPTKIPCDYLGREGSRRAEILFSAIEPYLKASMTYLDIGCGTAPLTLFIDELLPPARYIGIDLNSEAIGACKSEYPHHTWLCIRSDAFVIEIHHDVVIHTGINSRRFNDAEIHGRILDTPDSGPSVVLLESGDYHDGPSDTHEIYEEIRELYRDRGFLLKREEVLVISHFPVPVRRYAVFIRS
ncbi:MAG: class I SAM-dependent methyltransferase [Deltaproteobacteria bacterium]|nr:class I SAM-dependent methyltransferase [Candidatus Zymogenaceae bacterium]